MRYKTPSSVGIWKAPKESTPLLYERRKLRARGQERRWCKQTWRGLLAAGRSQEEHGHDEDGHLAQ